MLPPVQILQGCQEVTIEHQAPPAVRVTEAMVWNCMDRTDRALASVLIQAVVLRDMTYRFRTEVQKIRKRYGTAEKVFLKNRAVQQGFRCLWILPCLRNFTSPVQKGRKKGICYSIRQHLRELADEVGGEIAERLSEVFGNMPLKGQ